MTSPLEKIRQEILDMSAYHVQKSGDKIKLDAMENPFPLPEVIREKYLERMASQNVNRYPDPMAEALRVKLKDLLHVPDGCDVLFGNGSDEIIQILMMSVAQHGAKVLSVEPSFVMYKMIARFCNVDYIGEDLQKDFSINIDRFLELIEKENPALIFLAQPNNPTGNLFSDGHVEQILDKAQGFVVIDEAYTAFADYDALRYLQSHNNVLILRTFSKLGLAGLRLGFLVAHSEYIEQFNKIRMPYNINVLTQLMVECVLDNYALLENQAQIIIELRQALTEQLCLLDKLEVLNSEANFITVRLKGGDANALMEALKQEGVLIKNLHGTHPLLQNCLRLTVGTKDENLKLYQAISENL